MSPGREWLLDVGLLVSGDDELPDLPVGSRLACRARLLLLPPALVSSPGYVWRIERIELETTPWIEEEPLSFVRDQDNVSYVRVPRTDVVPHLTRDGARVADYLVRCSLVPNPGTAA